MSHACGNDFVPGFVAQSPAKKYKSSSEDHDPKMAQTRRYLRQAARRFVVMEPDILSFHAELEAANCFRLITQQEPGGIAAVMQLLG